MDIRHFRLIKTIAEEGSIANSSEKLFLTQSALSHQLKDLESQLGFKIFHRTRNKWDLTEEGNQLYKIACEIIDSMDRGFDTLKQIQKGSVGTIRLSTECYSFYQGLPSFIQKMGMLYPDIKVDLVIGATHNPIPQLISNEIDVAITTEKPTDSKLMSIDLFQDEVMCIMHKEHHLNAKEYLDFSCFSDVHLFIHSYPLESVSIYSRFLKPNGITPKKITAIPFLSLVFEMIAANMGVITLPKHILKSFNLSDQITLKKIGENGLKRTQYLVIRKSDKDKKYINDFLLNFEEQFQKIE